jgi:hypothetical protein
MTLYFAIVLLSVSGLMGCRHNNSSTFVPPIHKIIQTQDLPTIHSTQLPFRLSIPRTWAKLTPNTMQLYRYFIYTHDTTAEFSLSQLDTPHINLLDNINRWRTQLKLPPTSQIHTTPLSTPLGAAKQILITDNNGSAIKVLILKTYHRHYFFKFMGDTQLVTTTPFPPLSKLPPKKHKNS